MLKLTTGAGEKPLLIFPALMALALAATSCGDPTREGTRTENTVEAETLQAEPSTLHSLGLRWPVKGDANANASVRVQYRRTGEAAWRDGFPLFRTHPSKLSPENRVPNGWLFAGSIVDLSPDTEYEVRAILTDPDGGNAERSLVIRTLVEPIEPIGMRLRYVVPEPENGGGTGTKDNPFRGLRAAQSAARPGDLFLLQPGVYQASNWKIDKHGTKERPIIYRAAEGQVILDGNGNERLVNAIGIQHVWFEGLTFRNARYLIVGHNGGNTVIRRSRFEVTQFGIAAINGGYHQSRGFLITDNIFIGRSSWPRKKGIESHHAISITGAGHVVSYNLIRNFGDGIHGTRHGRLSASDIQNNEIDGCTDDGIEADYADTNVRIFRNRITNCFAAISAQPVHGGPLYIYGNAIYNVQYSPFKLHNHTSGILIFHNTSVTSGFPFNIEPERETVNDVITRNNLFIGTAGPGLRSTGVMTRCDFDNDGYGGFDGPFALWNDRTFSSPEAAKRSGALYRRHGALIMNASSTFYTGLPPPKSFNVRYAAHANNPRLGEKSPAIDRGVILANFADKFAGKAPDLGCCEFDEPLPHYGPRATPRH